MQSRVLRAGAHVLELSTPHVMGILNVTPDSFSDGGKHNEFERAVSHAEAMLEAGATIIDVGGESTRPGAQTVSAQEELDRVAPLVEALVQRFNAVVSVDTSTPDVMRESARLGAAIINDVRSLRRDGAMQAAAETEMAVCVMHMRGEPQTMQNAPHYNDVGLEVAEFLRERVDACLAAGISKDRLMIDPGFGFAKTLAHNLELFKRMPELHSFDLPLLVGVSRKTMIGQILDRPVNERLYGSLGLAMMALERGASIIRVHDVAATADIVKVFQAVVTAGEV